MRNAVHNNYELLDMMPLISGDLVSKIILDDAQRVDPNVTVTQATNERDCILKSFREPRPRDPLHPLCLLLGRGLQYVSGTPL